MSFTPGIPSVGESLGKSRSEVLNNFSSLRATIAVNHIDVNAIGVGKHKYIQIPVGSLPAGLVAGDANLYAKTLLAQSHVYFSQGNSGVEVPITAPYVANRLNDNGAGSVTAFSFLAGAYLRIFGFATNAGNGSVLDLGYQASGIYSIQLMQLGGSSSGNPVVTNPVAITLSNPAKGNRTTASIMMYSLGGSAQSNQTMYFDVIAGY